MPAQEDDDGSNVIGWLDVPSAIRVPLTVIFLPFAIQIIASESIPSLFLKELIYLQ
ncbi:hypothetical protein JW960_15400 [candidate division KSB1 bacterium]|nr:hypothetical protein [candidate division KSB1 bacterium]